MQVGVLIARAKGRPLSDFDWLSIFYNLVLHPTGKLVGRTAVLLLALPLGLAACALAFVVAVCYVCFEVIYFYRTGRFFTQQLIPL